MNKQLIIDRDEKLNIVSERIDSLSCWLNIGAKGMVPADDQYFDTGAKILSGLAEWFLTLKKEYKEEVSCHAYEQ